MSSNSAGLPHQGREAMMKRYSDVVDFMEERRKYQISVETSDPAVLKHVSEVLKNHLLGSGRQYRIEYRFETGASSFIRWLLK